MKTVLLVAAAGGVGSAARYLVSLGALRLFGPGFPYGTLTVNVVGSFVIALIMQLALRTEAITPLVRVVLTTGFLGGFTTYSAFNYESLDMMSRGAWRTGFANLVITVVACLAAGSLGFRVARTLVGR
jgi:CrcB protein